MQPDYDKLIADYYAKPTIAQQQIDFAPLYARYLASIKAKALPVQCGRCQKPVTDDEFVKYQGYCDDCLFRVNNRHLV